MDGDFARVFQGSDGQWRFDLVSHGNNEVISVSEGYHHRQDVFDMLEAHFPEYRIVDWTPDK